MKKCNYSTRTQAGLALVFSMALLGGVEGCSSATPDESGKDADARFFVEGVSAQLGSQPETVVSGATTQASGATQGEVLMKLAVARLGALTIIDEDPALEEPQLGVLLVSSTTDTLDLPVAHPDGTQITPYEYVVSLTRDSDVPERIRLQHRQIRGNLETKAVTMKALVLSSGSCASASWTTYFNGQASALGGVGAPVHLLNQTTAPNYYFYGNFSTYSNIIGGVCFASQADGNDDLHVRMERRIPNGGNWSAIAGTAAVLETAGANNRYRYSSTSFSCSSYERRIRVNGLPPGGPSPADFFHISGAWGGLSGCWIEQ